MEETEGEKKTPVDILFAVSVLFSQGNYISISKGNTTIESCIYLVHVMQDGAEQGRPAWGKLAV